MPVDAVVVLAGIGRYPRPKREATQSSLRHEASQQQMALAGRGKAVGPPGELRIGPRFGVGKGDNAMMQRRAGVRRSPYPVAYARMRSPSGS